MTSWSCIFLLIDKTQEHTCITKDNIPQYLILLSYLISYIFPIDITPRNNMVQESKSVSLINEVFYY